jgi:hypothetical protein
MFPMPWQTGAPTANRVTVHIVHNANARDAYGIQPRHCIKDHHYIPLWKSSKRAQMTQRFWCFAVRGWVKRARPTSLMKRPTHARHSKTSH